MPRLSARFARATVSAVFVLAAGAPSMAAVTRLSDLLQPNASLQVGDKLFDHFEFTPTGTDTSGIDASNIQVLPLTVGDYGIRFQPISGNSIISIGPSATLESYADMLIRFQVHVTHPSNYISGVSLSFGATSPADGIAGVTEDAYNGTTQLGHLVVSTLNNTYTDQAAIPGIYRDIEINKDVAVWGGAEEGASIGWIEQRFAQTPEPTALVLLAVGGFFMVRRRGIRALGVSAAAIALLAGGLAVNAPAHATLLSTLTGGGTVTSLDGKFQFSNFSVDPIVKSGRTAGSASTVDVSPIVIDGQQGLRFAGLVSSLGASSLEMKVHYTATALTPGELIDASFFRFNGATTGTPASATVSTNIVNGLTSVGTGAISAASLAQLSLTVPLSTAFSTINVTDTINVNSGTGATANLSYLDQVFTAMPEPAAGLLLVIGGLFMARRRFL